MYFGDAFALGLLPMYSILAWVFANLHLVQNASIPVTLCPIISVWMSWVPS